MNCPFPDRTHPTKAHPNGRAESFSHSKGLKRHLNEKHHILDKPRRVYYCPMESCKRDQYFERKAAAERHIEKTHVGVKVEPIGENMENEALDPYPICNSQFPNGKERNPTSMSHLLGHYYHIGVWPWIPKLPEKGKGKGVLGEGSATFESSGIPEA